VTYRSLGTTVQYVYPFMTPVSDFGVGRCKLNSVDPPIA
jgi:hypothetical protein